jgi:hypothetical protein
LVILLLVEEVLSQFRMKLGVPGKAVCGVQQTPFETADVRGNQINFHQHGKRQRIVGPKPIGLLQCVTRAGKIASGQRAGCHPIERIVWARVVGSGAGRLVKIFRGPGELAMTKLHLGFSIQLLKPRLALRGTKIRGRALRGKAVRE